MPKQKTKNIILAAGGTGGHLSPAISLAQNLHNKKHKVILITDQRCKSYLPKNLKFKTIILDSYRPSTQKNIIKIIRLIFSNHISHIVSFGGYTSITANFAAIFTLKKLIIHEQNTILGRSNQFFANFANNIACGFPNIRVKKHLTKKLIYTGNPVKEEFLQLKKVTKSSRKQTILAFGGSQGAKFITELLIKILKDIPQNDIKKLHLILQTRKELINSTKKQLNKIGVSHEINHFYLDMPKKMNQADLIISRAGASSIAEILHLEKPAIFIPYKYASNNHQLYNAKFLSDAKAAILQEENKINIIEIESLVKNLNLESKNITKNIKKLKKAYPKKALENLIIS